MEEKKKRVVTKIGDVFCAEIEGKYKMYFLFIAIDKTDLSGNIIRVFKKRYPLTEIPKIEYVVQGEVLFHAQVYISWGIKQGLWDKIGKVKFEESVRLPFKTFNRNNRDLLAYDWRLWYNNEPAIEITGPLPEEFVNAEWGGISPPVSIIERMLCGGKRSGYLGRRDKIMAADISFEEKRDLMLKPYPWNDEFTP